MTDYLVFRLYGPMASWGEIAVGEVRSSADHPTRSAIMGLVAAALGIDRREVTSLAQLDNGYDVAIKTVNRGTLLKDYHTVQVAGSTGNAVYPTRRNELLHARSRLGTILSSREYYCDAYYLVALRDRDTAPIPLVQIQEALVMPKYQLYLGRKSCPVAAPLKPQIVSVNGFREALTTARFPPPVVSNTDEDILERFFTGGVVTYHWEGTEPDLESQMIRERHDLPVNRARWQFSVRQEHSQTVKGGE